MGRLDDAAKRKVVELRQAGLSFRKIKAVLELENIRVSAQAIYLYLKEFQRKKVQRGGESAAAPDPQTTPAVGPGRGDGGSREGWNDQQIRNLLREASRHAGYVAASEFAKQCPGSTPPEVRGQGPSGTGGEGASRGQSNRTEKQEEGNKKEDEDKDIQIVSVTSLAQNSQQRGLPPAGAAAVTVTGAYMRKRATPSPATNPILAARKRLLDKALSHRAKIRDSSYQSYQQVAALLRREQSNAPGSDVQRPVAADQPQSYDPVAQRLTQVRNLDGQQGASVPRQMFQQRVGGQAVRSPHPAPPRVGIRLPNPPPPPPTSQGSSPVIRLQSPGSQGMNQGLLRRDRNPSPQQAAHQEAGGRCGGGSGGGLQEQVQTLGSEIHSLSLAVRMLVEQQYRLEREQVQQTQVQRQILSTLQTLASRLEAPCTSLHQQRQHPKTPPPPVLPASGSASYSQDTFPFSQGGYAQCSQAQPSYNGMDSSSLETIETFKLSGQSPHGINGFQTGSISSTTDSLTLTHTPTYTLAHTQPYSSAYTQQPHTQTHMPSCTQSYATTYTQSHTQSYRGTDSTDYPSTCTEGALQDCMAPTQASVDLDSDITVSPQETQLNIIKVEAL
ncbi:uncharacterized protein LOC129833843 isoform X1 [Salvelinus fontinalis]|uniref:uncharacterized protein LOC129833843 isoform X1 n=1 Tax=Salvelinus fontinalis TaxID=8038 RepID=UPI002484E75F|nr:uncharacterized protein LOC129833843 isoform X1 [Salvelinus fontinalis]XP_055754648.1 uncharacterized protein LOC129833843 isoform X1 [Salvelinus fontinalis]